MKKLLVAFFFFNFLYVSHSQTNSFEQEFHVSSNRCPSCYVYNENDQWHSTSFLMDTANVLLLEVFIEEKMVLKEKRYIKYSDSGVLDFVARMDSLGTLTKLYYSKGFIKRDIRQYANGSIEQYDYYESGKLYSKLSYDISGWGSKKFYNEDETFNCIEMVYNGEIILNE